jgi:hypothetical protein
MRLTIFRLSTVGFSGFNFDYLIFEIFLQFPFSTMPQIPKCGVRFEQITIVSTLRDQLTLRRLKHSSGQDYCIYLFISNITVKFHRCLEVKKLSQLHVNNLLFLQVLVPCFYESTCISNISNVGNTSVGVTNITTPADNRGILFILIHSQKVLSSGSV